MGVYGFMLIVCIKCQKEMSCHKTGVGINYGNGHVYPGDIYKCKECEFEMIVSEGRSVHDANLNIYSEYINMI